MVEQQEPTAYVNPYKFNAKELDSETGLYYYGARYYNPKLSIWYGVDPLAVYNPVMETEFYGDGQHNGVVFYWGNLNPYTYCYQNPIIYVDPNGKQNKGSQAATVGAFTIPRSAGFSIRLGVPRIGGIMRGGGLPGMLIGGLIILEIKQKEIRERKALYEQRIFDALPKDEQKKQILQGLESGPIEQDNSISREFPAAIPQKITILSAEKKVPVPGKSGKEAAKDAPSWAKGEAPYVGEDGKTFAGRLMDNQYGEGEWNKSKKDTGPGSEHNKIKKWGDRGFQDPPKKK